MNASADDLLRSGEKRGEDEYLVAIRSYGVHVQVILPDASWVADLVPYLPPYWHAVEPSEPGPNDIHYDASQHLEPVSADNGDMDGYRLSRPHVATNLGSKIEYAVAERSEQFVFVHAGVVRVNDRAWLFPGESHAGKSTLVAALIKQGATYYSDEYAVITDSGLVLPYPRRIAMRNDLYFPLGRTDVSRYGPLEPEAEEGIPAAKIAFLRYQAGRDLDFEQLDRTSALIALCTNTVGFRDRPDMSFAYLNMLLDRAPVCIQGTRSDATEAARLILESVDS